MPSNPIKPSYQDVLDHIKRLQQGSAGRLVQVSTIGKSVQGRDLPSVMLTDPSIPPHDKQHLLIVASQHGSEESGRAIAMELMDWLVSGDPEASEVLRKQIVAVVPCANPDGAVEDNSRNADGVDIAHTYAYDAAAATPEGRHLEQLALEFVPDVVVDIHGRAGGGMKEHAWLMPAWGFSSDRYFLTAISMAMGQAGEAVGFPQAEFDPPMPFEPGQGNVLMLGEKLAGELKSLSLGLETIEQYYREPDWRATGLVRLRRLLRFGMEDAFGLGESGYPNSLVSGNRVQGLKAHGKTAAARRQNRVEMTTFLRRNWAIADRGADGVDRCARVRVCSKTCVGQNPQRFAILLRFKKPCKIKVVKWQNRALPLDDDHGYRSWEDQCSLFVQANISEPFGGPERFLVVRYDSPYFDE